MQAELAIQLLLSRVLHCKKKGYNNVALCGFCLLKNASLNIERFICSRLLMPYFYVLHHSFSFTSVFHLTTDLNWLPLVYDIFLSWKWLSHSILWLKLLYKLWITVYIIQCWDFDFHGQKWFLILDDYPFQGEVILAYLFYCCSMAANSEMEKKSLR